MNNPTHSHLVELWLKNYFDNKSCAIFFNPSGGADRVREIAMVCGLSSRDDAMSMLTSDIYICPISKDKLINFLNNLDQNIYGYVMAWNGFEFITHN